MIYTVTLNPSLDYSLTVPCFIAGATNRSTQEHITFGGKGLNVSAMLCRFHLPSVAIAFASGFTGDEIEAQAQAFGISTNFIRLENGCSRINIKLKDEEETEINAGGPNISSKALETLFNALSYLKAEDTLVLSGSIPPSLPQSIYRDIILSLPHGVTVVVDCTGDALLQALPLCPLLIKPNLQELSAVFGVPISSTHEVLHYGKKLQAMGAKNVLVSMGGDGALLITQNEGAYFAHAPKGTVVSTVGSGDAMIAGFLKEWASPSNMETALMGAIATGSACAFSSSFATEKEVESLKQTLSNPQKIC